MTKPLSCWGVGGERVVMGVELIYFVNWRGPGYKIRAESKNRLQINGSVTKLICFISML